MCLQFLDHRSCQHYREPHAHPYPLESPDWKRENDSMGDLRSILVPDRCQDAASWEDRNHVFCEITGETQAYLPRTKWLWWPCCSNKHQKHSILWKQMGAESLLVTHRVSRWIQTAHSCPAAPKRPQSYCKVSGLRHAAQESAPTHHDAAIAHLSWWRTTRGHPCKPDGGAASAQRNPQETQRVHAGGDRRLPQAVDTTWRLQDEMKPRLPTRRDQSWKGFFTSTLHWKQQTPWLCYNTWQIL